MKCNLLKNDPQNGPRTPGLQNPLKKNIMTLETLGSSKVPGAKGRRGVISPTITPRTLHLYCVLQRIWRGNKRSGFEITEL